MKKILILLLPWLLPVPAAAQAMGVGTASFLDYPVSAHVAALGGVNAAFYGSESGFQVLNPALLTQSAVKTVHLNYSFYLARTGYGSGSYSMALSENDFLGAGFQFAHYGEVDGYYTDGTPLGRYTAQDFALSASYARLLNRYFSIGVTLKPALSHYADYNYFSLGADMGIQFTDTAHCLAVGLTVRNFGGRIAGSEQLAMASRWMPVHLNLGFVKRFRKAPFALHFTLQDLQKWKYDYAVSGVESDGRVKAGLAFARKIVLGVDVVPRNDRFFLALSYNFDRGLSLQNPYVLSVAGLSLGGGVRLQAFHFGLGVSFFGKSAVTTHLTLSMDIDHLNKKKL